MNKKHKTMIELLLYNMFLDKFDLTYVMDRWIDEYDHYMKKDKDVSETRIYEKADDFYAIIGYNYESENLLQELNINCTSDLLELFVNIYNDSI